MIQPAGVGPAGLGMMLHNDICLPYLLSLGTDEQKARWLPGVCSGELITAIGDDRAGDRVRPGLDVDQRDP